MKAVQIDEYGNNEVVHIIDAEIPNPKENEVLVRVTTAGINPIDWKIRNGAGQRMGLTFPIGLGGGIVGEIEKLGPNVSKFKVGDVIYGMVKVGGFAEYVVAKTTDIALKPEELSDEQAAAIPLCGLTAWQGIFDLGKLQEGQKILITGASGGVGSLAVQLAKSKGAYVVGTASGKNKDFVLNLGADEFINYETQNFEDIVKGMDVVFDTVGGETFEKCFLTVKKAGALVTSVAFPTAELNLKYGIEAQRVFCKANSEQINSLSELYMTGKLKARVSKVFPLSQVKEALALSENGGANGKLVLRIKF